MVGISSNTCCALIETRPQSSNCSHYAAYCSWHVDGLSVRHESNARVTVMERTWAMSKAHPVLSVAQVAGKAMDGASWGASNNDTLGQPSASSWLCDSLSKLARVESNLVNVDDIGEWETAVMEMLASWLEHHIEDLVSILVR